MKPFSSALMMTVALIAGSGCAAKTVVQWEMDRRDERIDRNIVAVLDKTLAYADATQQRFDAVDQRIDRLEVRTTELQDQVQTTTTARADGADARLSRLSAHRSARTVVNTLQVEFAFDESALDDAAKRRLSVLVGELRAQPKLVVDLEGYTDSRGSRQYNARLSQRRIEAVRRYLVDQGVERHRIKGAARGRLDTTAMPDERKRRVDIKLAVAAEGSETAR